MDHAQLLTQELQEESTEIRDLRRFFFFFLNLSREKGKNIFPESHVSIFMCVTETEGL